MKKATEIEPLLKRQMLDSAMAILMSNLVLELNMEQLMKTTRIENISPLFFSLLQHLHFTKVQES